MRPLQQGSRIAIVSPAGRTKPELVEAGARTLRLHGYEPVVMPHALADGPLYYAGTREQRLSDLHAAYADPSIDAVLCTRGGWGSAELLPLLDRDLLRANPKLFIGYSDVTSIHAWLWKECDHPSFYAPMLAADWSKPDGVHTPSWNAALHGSNTLWRLSEADGLRILRSGAVEGRLLGGCISILCAALGTPYALRLTEPTVLFLEDINTRPYQWDRMLQHLKFAGWMEHVVGIVLGDMSANGREDELAAIEASCLHALADFNGPIAIGLECGHVSRLNRTLPLGTHVELICDVLPSIEFVGASR